MEKTYKYWINREGGNSTGKYYWFNSFKIYLAYRQMVSEQLHKFDWEQSFTGQFLSNGFKAFDVQQREKQVNPTINWFGTSVYDPDTYYVKDNKALIMSLQGMAAPYNARYKDLFNSGSVKYIKLMEDNKTIYEDWSGNLPNKETVKQFLNG